MTCDNFHGHAQEFKGGGNKDKSRIALAFILKFLMYKLNVAVSPILNPDHKRFFLSVILLQMDRVPPDYNPAYLFNYTIF